MPAYSLIVRDDAPGGPVAIGTLRLSDAIAFAEAKGIPIDLWCVVPITNQTDHANDTKEFHDAL